VSAVIGQVRQIQRRVGVKSQGERGLHPPDEDLSLGTPAMQISRLLAGLTDQTEHVYGEARYAAGSWKHDRRVIIKAEVVRVEGKEPTDNLLFMITNMNQTPQWLYGEAYFQRGEIENRIRELHAMEIDCTSCIRFSTPATKTLRWGPRFRPTSSVCC